MQIPRGMPASLSQGKGEKKSIDTTAFSVAPGGVSLAINTTGSIIPLNLVSAGSSFFNRIGRKIEMTDVSLKLQTDPLSVTRASQQDYVRVLIIYDRQTNGATPILADILQDTGNTGANTTESISGMNLNNRDRFQVILDKKYNLPQVTNTAGVLTNIWPTNQCDVQEMMLNQYRKMNRLVTHFGADSAPPVIGDIRTGGLFLVTMGALAAGTENFQGNEWAVRVRYYDT